MGCCLSVAGQKKRPPVNERARTRRLALDRLVDLAGIASDNRCRTPIWAFSTITARMAPGGSAYPFTTAAWTRHIKPLMDEALRTALRLRPTEVDVALRVGLICASVGRADRATVDGPGPQKYCLGLAMEYRSLWVQCALIAAKICRFHATTASVERDARPVSSAFRPQVNPWRVRELLAARNVW